MGSAVLNARVAAGLAVLVTLAIHCGGCIDVAADRAPLAISVTTWPGASVPMEGVEICETDTQNCALTDFQGFARLYLPVDEEVSFTLVRDGYQSELQPFVMPPTETTLRLTLGTEQRLQEQFDAAMSPYPPKDTGMIVIATTPPCEGVTVEAYGSAGKGRIFYIGDNSEWDLDLDATSRAGISEVIELLPGEYRVELGGSASNCFPLTGWPSPFENSVRLPVKAGFFTEVRMACDCR